MMRSENSYFDVYPRIVRAGNSAAIHIHPLFDHVRFIDGETYDISIQPMEETGFSKDPIAFKAQPIDGDLIVNFQLSRSSSCRSNGPETITRNDCLIFIFTPWQMTFFR
jgi:hypothetical protein